MILPRVLAETSRKFAQKTAIIFKNHHYTFEEIYININRSARLLLLLGIKKGDRVLFKAPKCMEFIYLHLATLSIGGITIPLNTSYKSKEVKYFIDDSECALMITTHDDYLSMQNNKLSFQNLQCMTIDKKVKDQPFYWDEMNTLITSQLPTYFSQENDVAMICYTSGTTGKPKGAMITHKNLVENMQALKRMWHWVDSDIILHVLPIFHIHGLIVGLHGSLNAGSTMIMHERFDPKDAWTAIEREKCTLMMGVPTMYFRLLNHWEKEKRKYRIDSMRVFISGSAPLSDNLFHRFKDMTGHTILERYGMTEAGMITSNPYEIKERKAQSVGYPLAGVEIRILDKNKNEVQPGKVGEVFIKGNNVFKGYYKNPAKTEESFLNNWFQSGDLGYQDPNDKMRLYIKGRSKELIITGGYNVYPKEIENRLEQHDMVKEAAVIGLSDEDFGEKVSAVVVKSRQDNSLDPKVLIEFCKEQLAGYKCPKAIIFCTKLPRNAMGKIQKEVLKKRYFKNRPNHQDKEYCK